MQKANLKKDFDKHNDGIGWLSLPLQCVSREQSELRSEFPKLVQLKDAGRSNYWLSFTSDVAAFVKSLKKRPSFRTFRFQPDDEMGGKVLVLTSFFEKLDLFSCSIQHKNYQGNKGIYVVIF